MVGFLPGSALLWLLSISSVVVNVQGSSQRAKPIQKTFHVSEVEVSVQSVSNQAQRTDGTLCSQDSFLLHFAVSPSQNPTSESYKKHFTLFLKPVHAHFLHPNAKIRHQSSNQSETKELPKPMISDQVLAYTGSVVQTDHFSNLNQSLHHWNQENESLQRKNWANILVHHPYGKNCVEINQNFVLEGAFEFHRRIWHIKSLHSYLRTKFQDDSDPSSHEIVPDLAPNMVAWSDSDEPRQETRNSTTVVLESAQVFNVEVTDGSDQYQPHYLQKRQTMASDIAGSTSQNVDYASTMGSTDGCPKSLKMVYMGIAVDCTYMRKYGSIDAVRLAVLNNMNLVSSLYQRTFNISLGIVEINVPAQSTCPSQPQPDLPWNSDCPTSPSGGLEIEQRLDQFSQWRSTKGSSDGAGLWHLMTDCPNGSEVGISWLGALCKVNAENGVNGGTTSGTGVTAASPSEWQTMAHEIGHNFGAVHDCTSGCTEGDSCCPATKKSCSGEQQYLMAPSSTSDTTSLFSPCSIGNICSSLKPGNGQGVDTSCVTEPGQRYIVSLNQCGNGILEPGEDCDPGAIYSPCCQWGVCKFSPGAVCIPSPGSPCCSSTCQFSPSATPCNTSSSAGQCSGRSSLCPADPAN